MSSIHPLSPSSPISFSTPPAAGIGGAASDSTIREIASGILFNSEGLSQAPVEQDKLLFQDLCRGAENGDIPLLERVISQVPEEGKKRDELLFQALCSGAENGLIPVLEWAFSKYLPGEGQEELGDILGIGAEKDKLPVVEWVFAKNGSMPQEMISTALSLCSSGSLNLNIFRFLLEKYESKTDLDLRDAFNNAARESNLSAIQFFLRDIESYGCKPIPISDWSTQVNGSLQRGDLPLLQCLLSKGRIITTKGVDFWTQTERIELLKLFATQNPDSIPSCIQKFGITDQTVLIEFATFCAKRNGATTAEYIQNFGITNQTALIEIAKLCAQENGQKTAELLGNFRIESPEAKESIQILCTIQSLSILAPNDSPPEAFTRFIAMADTDPSTVEAFNFYGKRSDIQTFLSSEYSRFKGAKKGDPVRLDYPLHYLMARYLAAESKRLRRSEDAGGVGASALIEGTIDTEIATTFIKILKLSNKPLQAYLISVLSTINNDPMLCGRFASLVEKGGTKAHSISYEPQRLILLSVANLFREIPGQEGIFTVSKKLILDAMSGNLEGIKDASTDLNIICLRTLMALQATPLSGEQKLHLFTQICRYCPTKDHHELFEKSIKYLQFLSESNFFSEGMPAIFSKEFTLDALEDGVKKIGKTTLFGKEEIDPRIQRALDANYLTISEAQRRPLALELYATRLRDADPATKKHLRRFLLSVFDASFSKTRYDVSLSPHLQVIARTFPTLWEKWKTIPDPEIVSLGATSRVSASGSQEETTTPFKVMITDDWEDLFLCGTEVIGSCQALEGLPGHNIALLGYCLDGKIQMVTVKDSKTGKIISRALLKLLLRKDNRSPVLFLERIYTDGRTANTGKLMQLAQKRAAELGIPLYLASEDDGKPQVVLQSLGSPASVEYSDAGNINLSSGIYEVRASLQL